MLDKLQEIVLSAVALALTGIVALAVGALRAYLAKKGLVADAQAAQVNETRAQAQAEVIVAAVDQTMAMKPGREKLGAALELAMASAAPVTKTNLEAAVAAQKAAAVPYPEPSYETVNSDGGPRT
jgi:hypothetical protein